MQPQSVHANNRRLIKNTLILYLRMLVAMGIGLMTPRVLLRNLGEIDFGLVSVIGSAISLCIFFSGALSTAATRFLTFEMGDRKSSDRIRNVFSLILEIHAGMVLLMILIGETLGAWYFHHKLQIPADRIDAGFAFLHATIAITAFNILIIPYNALLIAHENMKAFSIISIAETCFHFLAAYLLCVAPGDRLQSYGFLYAAFTGLIFLSYVVVCRRKYSESRFRFHFNRKDFKEIFLFSSWNALGNTAWASSEVLVSLLLNAFFGPLVNAAKGIANQIFSYFGRFTQSFLTATRPQIVKYWASQEHDQFERIILATCKYGYFLLLLCTIPAVLEMPLLLRLWLGKYPDYTVGFADLTLFCGLVNYFSFPIVYGMQATGKIAFFELFGSGIRFIVFPLAWFFLWKGFSPLSAMYVNLAVTILCVAVRLVIMARATKLSLTKILWDVFAPLLIVTALSFLGVFLFISPFHPTPLRILWTIFISTILTTFLFSAIAMTREERTSVRNKLTSFSRRMFDKIHFIQPNS